MVYVLVGVLAAQAAVGAGGETTDSEGALLRVLQAPSGSLLLGLVAIGLTGYAVWCALAAAFDVDRKDGQLQSVLTRIGYAATAVIYAGLAMTAIGLAVGVRGATNGDQAAQDRTAWLLGQPLGPVLVALAGAVVIGVGISHLVIAVKASFCEWLTRRPGTGSAPWAASATPRTACPWAYRGFLVGCRRSPRADEARGLGGALAALVQQPFGPTLLGALGLGLAAYGAFMLVEARYRRMVID